ncbi:MAG: CTP synthetase [Parcubacteria group bacterium GW2011_GWA2_49_9]|nr:MAG: CTP synthetase [Parcubacteria group bacterium GW2011_GWA2_49_9]
MTHGNNRKYIFVVGGVMSSVGKGVAAASIGAILQGKGFKVTAMKIDPYVNVDAGTMNPTEHGEVFVLDDGMECDQDMGNYERFLGIDLTRTNYMTTGSIYLRVIQKERNLEYKGRCVHVVPDIPLAAIEQIKKAGEEADADIVIIEVGGTVGDYQNVLYLEAVRFMKFEQPEDTLLVLVSYIPALGVGGNELKTKPTQHAVRFLNGSGLHPDMVLARSSGSIDDKRKEKLEYMCGLAKGSIVSAPDVESIYDIPLNFEKDHLSDFILKKLALHSDTEDLKEWKELSRKIHAATETVKVGIVGKYFDTGNFVLSDAYISVIEAIKHSAYSLGKRPELTWINSKDFETGEKDDSMLKDFDGIIVPGGFGESGIEGKIKAIEYARVNKIPYFGLCYGMQLATIEYARHVAGLEGANTTEINKDGPHPVIDIMPEQKKHMAEGKYGATMRLGAYPCMLEEGTIAYASYVKSQKSKVNGRVSISERHRHRFEVNPEYIPQLEKAGLVFSGKSPDGVLMEIAELPTSVHPFFLGTQFHPELKSRPLAPHPLFTAFLKAGIERSKEK